MVSVAFQRVWRNVPQAQGGLEVELLYSRAREYGRSL